MKVLAILLVMAVILFLIWAIMTAIAGAGARRARRRMERGAWSVHPRSDALTGETKIVLVCPGEDDFLFWPKADTQSLAFDMAMLEAESQAAEFNRVQRRKEIGHG